MGKVEHKFNMFLGQLTTIKYAILFECSCRTYTEAVEWNPNNLLIICHMCGINVFEYLCDIIGRSAAWSPNIPIEKYRDLFPDRWEQKQRLLLKIWMAIFYRWYARYEY